MKGNHLGEFEELVLLTVYGAEGEAYGVTIQEKLEESVERRVSIGAVYAALDRLEGKGYLKSWTGGATEERGGRRKRFFKTTRSGIAVLKDMRRIRERIWREIEA
jgi:DNA-binding PadR family transcriptional regulator